MLCVKFVLQFLELSAIYVVWEECCFGAVFPLEEGSGSPTEFPLVSLVAVDGTSSIGKAFGGGS